MKMFFKYLFTAIKYFILQSAVEIVAMVLLIYLGLPYFEMNAGNESLSEIMIGIAGYYTFSKCIYYSWIYLLLFIGMGVYKKFESQFTFSVLNGVLSLLFIVLILLRGKPLDWILNPLIATVVTSLIIILVTRVTNKNKSPQTT